jgi:hypothetical protein
MTTEEAYHCNKESESGERREGAEESNGKAATDANDLHQY